MSVGHSGHGVDLEVLVGTDGSGGLNGSPVGESGLSIVEPGVAQVLHVVVVDVGDTLGNLGSVESAAEGKDLATDVLVNVGVVLLALEGLEQVGAATDNLNVVQEVRVDGGQADTAVVHLTGEDFVTEEVVSEETGVRVGEVVAVSSGDINELTEESVHGVVLLLDVVKVLSVLVDSVGAEHVLEEQESVVVFVLDGGSIVEDTDVRVDHLIITDEEERGSQERSLGVNGFHGGGLGNASEGLVNLVNELVVVDGTGSNNNDVITEVVSSSVASEHISVEVLKLVSLTLDGLAEHVVSEGVEVGVLQSGVLVVLSGGRVLSGELLLGELNLSGVEGSVGEGITEERHSSADITLEDLEAEGGLLTASLIDVSATHVFDILSELSLGAGRSSSSDELLEEVRGTSGLEGVLTGASTDVHTNTKAQDELY